MDKSTIMSILGAMIEILHKCNAAKSAILKRFFYAFYLLSPTLLANPMDSALSAYMECLESKVVELSTTDSDLVKNNCKPELVALQQRLPPAIASVIISQAEADAGI